MSLRVDDAWESLVSAGLAAVEAKDAKNWELGDLAGRVVKCYGENRLGQYAQALRYDRSTLRDYRRVSAFYAPDYRELFPMLRWSHYRTAMRAGDVEEALDWLEQASDGDWPIQILRAKLREALGEDPTPLKVSGGAVVDQIHERRLVLVVDPDVRLDLMDVGARVQVVITVERDGNQIQELDSEIRFKRSGRA